jgi:hypothetical protein
MHYPFWFVPHLTSPMWIALVAWMLGKVFEANRQHSHPR